MSKFHINKHGVPAPCKATKENCPLGGADYHFDSVEEAQNFIDKENVKRYSLLPDMSLNLSPESRVKLDTQLAVINYKINPEKFISPTGNFGNNKPSNGGFWTSTVGEDGDSGWTRWARKEGFYESIKGDGVSDVAVIKVSKDANVLTINNKQDYEKILEKYKEDKENSSSFSSLSPKETLDFEKVKEDYDAVRVTDKAIHELPNDFRDWSVESTLWLNIDKFEKVEYGEGAYDENKSVLEIPEIELLEEDKNTKAQD